jgi:hypothetical protein
VTFDATPPAQVLPVTDLQDHASISVCELNAVESLIVRAVRWAGSVHADPSLTEARLQDAFDGAGMGGALPVLTRYLASIHGTASPTVPAELHGCWRLNALEAHTLHALACLQAERFGDAWRTLVTAGQGLDISRAMLTLSEVADALTAVGSRVRPWRDLSPAV